MIGIDIISINRIQKFIDRFGNKGLKKFLCQSEIELIKSTKTVAGFWAAKEAISKALGCGIGKNLFFHDMIISKTRLNAPIVTLNKKVKEFHSVKNIAISITHDSGVAIAIAFVQWSHNPKKI